MFLCLKKRPMKPIGWANFHHTHDHFCLRIHLNAQNKHMESVIEVTG